MANDRASEKADERGAVRGAAKSDQEHGAVRGQGGERDSNEAESGAAAKEATELAKETVEKQVTPGNPAVQLAGAGRVAAMARADKLADDERSVLGDKTSEGGSRGGRQKHGQHAGKSFVAVHAMLRSGRPVYPGDPVSFDADEDQHVSDLLQQGTIVEGSEGAEEVEEALGRADLARGRALAQSGF